MPVIRSKGTKTDAELFAEWERPEIGNWLACDCEPDERIEHYAEICSAIRKKRDVIAEELGEKLWHFRIERLEARLNRPWWKFWA